MIGTIVNVCSIVCGSAVGSVAKRGIKEEYREAAFNALGVATLMLGAKTCIGGMEMTEYPMLFIASLAVGSVVGRILDLDGRAKRFAERHGGKDLAAGLTTAVLLFCVGTLSIVGPMMSALKGDNTFLFTNATLDFVGSMVLASSYGFGIALAGVVLFAWQGSIYGLSLLAGGEFVSEAMLADLSVVGGALIFALGLGILKIKDCRTVDMVVGLVVVVMWHLVVV